jgi:hypothetical protein
MNYYLTFDIGTKNLAYCIAKYDKSKNIISKQIEIIDCDVVNIADVSLLCKEIKNKRAICNNKAHFYSLKDKKNHADINNITGYCKSHHKIIQEQNKNNKINKTTDLNIQTFRMSSNPLFTANLNTRLERLLMFLDKLFIIINTPYNLKNNKIQNLKIYIENQPALITPIMKTISVCIFTYFLYKKLYFPNVINSVNFISANSKTNKVFIDLMKKKYNIYSYITNFKNYNNRKNFSIEIATQIANRLSNTKNLLNIINTSKFYVLIKKDDLADTFLYVLYAILCL